MSNYLITNSLNHRIIYYLILMSNIIFVLLFIGLSYYNRIAIDDFYFLANVKEHGVIKGTIIEHSLWSGRWVSVFLNQLVLSFYNYKYFLFIFGIFTFGFFIYSVNRLINNINVIFKLASLNTYQSINISIFIISALFYSTVKIDETWFWLCASCTYLYSIIMLLLGSSALISPKKTYTNTLICSISFIYVGGSCEPLALLVILILTIILFISKLGIFANYKSNILTIRLLNALFCCLISFIILYIAEGNRVREQYFEEINIFHAFILNIKTTGMIILLRLPHIILPVLLFSITAYYLGYKNSNNNTINKKNIKNLIATVLFLYFAIIFLYQFPVTYATQDIAAYRALFPISLFSLMASGIIFYGLGCIKCLKISIFKLAILLSLFTIIGINIYVSVYQMKLLPQYTKSYDDRIILLMANKNNTAVLKVKSLPNSGLLYSAEISTDSLYFANKHLKKGLGLNSSVVLSLYD